jgi:hypothetical protein
MLVMAPLMEKLRFLKEKGVNIASYAASKGTVCSGVATAHFFTSFNNRVSMFLSGLKFINKSDCTATATKKAWFLSSPSRDVFVKPADSAILLFYGIVGLILLLLKYGICM